MEFCLEGKNTGRTGARKTDWSVMTLRVFVCLPNIFTFFYFIITYVSLIFYALSIGLVSLPYILIAIYSIDLVPAVTINCRPPNINENRCVGWCLSPAHKKILVNVKLFFKHTRPPPVKLRTADLNICRLSHCFISYIMVVVLWLHMIWMTFSLKNNCFGGGTLVLYGQGLTA